MAEQTVKYTLRGALLIDAMTTLLVRTEMASIPSLHEGRQWCLDRIHLDGLSPEKLDLVNAIERYLKIKIDETRR